MMLMMQTAHTGRADHAKFKSQTDALFTESRRISFNDSILRLETSCFDNVLVGFLETAQFNAGTASSVISVEPRWFKVQRLRGQCFGLSLLTKTSSTSRLAKEKGGLE